MKQVTFRLKFFVALFLIVMAAGTVGFMVTEGLSLLDAFYFNIVTMATVGYGDIHPTTTVGKGIAVLLIILGTGAFLGVFANATELMLSRRDELARSRKLHIIIGLYFGEIGGWLLMSFVKADPELERVRGSFLVKSDWSAGDFAAARKELRRYDFNLAAEALDLSDLAGKLGEKRGFMVRLLENPALLEQESFAEHLRAVLHLAEEFSYRPGFETLPHADLQHLAGDMRRAYASLVEHWLSNMEHLKDHYPYLFSLAVRTNPFDREAAVVFGQ